MADEATSEAVTEVAAVAKLYHPDKAVTVLSYQGDQIVADKDGAFTVPETAVAHLVESFGFVGSAPEKVNEGGEPGKTTPTSRNGR